MQKLLLFSGIDQPSLEYCMIRKKETSVFIDSVIIGKSGNEAFRLDYEVETSNQWQTLSFYYRFHKNGSVEEKKYLSNGRGQWESNGQEVETFEGCHDIDIPLTPFTNSLPINRLGLQVGESSRIRVVYFDLAEGIIKPVEQNYKRLGPDIYHYENVPNDFEADITVDDEGLVVDYPQLFRRLHVTDLR